MPVPAFPLTNTIGAPASMSFATTRYSSVTSMPSSGSAWGGWDRFGGGSCTARRFSSPMLTGLIPSMVLRESSRPTDHSGQGPRQLSPTLIGGQRLSLILHGPGDSGATKVGKTFMGAKGFENERPYGNSQREEPRIPNGSVRCALPYCKYRRSVDFPV